MSYVSSDPTSLAQFVLVVQSTVSTANEDPTAQSSLTTESVATAESDMMAQSGVPTTSDSQLSSGQMALTQSVLVVQSTVSTATQSAGEDPMAQSSLMTESGATAESDMMAQSSQPTSDQMALTQSVPVAQSTVPTDPTLTAQTDVEAQSISSPSFHNLLMVPKKYGQAARSVPQVKRNRKVGHAAVITASPYKRELEGMKSDKLKKQQAVEERKAAGTAKKELQVKKIEKELQKKAHTRNKVPVQSKECKRKKDLHDGEKTQPLQKRMRKSTHSKPNDADVSCLYCAELFSQSAKREKWIQCEQCMQWAHAACSGVGDKDKHFRCELC